MLGAAASAGMGLLMQRRNNRVQLQQSQALQNQQVAGSKQLMDYQRQLAMQTWEDTNYKAQVEQMRKAGLNVGLMYGQGGPGGTLMQPSAQVSGQAAQGSTGQEWSQGMGLVMQAGLTQAQIELMKAQTEKAKAEAVKTAGVDTGLAQAQTSNLNQITENQEIISKGLEYENTIKQVEANVATQTERTAIDKINMEYESVVATVRKQRMEANISEATAEQVIERINNEAAQSYWNVIATKAGIDNTEANTALAKQIKEKTQNEIQIMWEQNQQRWDDLSLKERQTKVQEILAGFSTNKEANYERWSRIIGNYGRAISGLIPND